MDDVKTYEVEIIHEPSGIYMNFTTELEGDHIDDNNAWEFILDELSVVANRID